MTYFLSFCLGRYNIVKILPFPTGKLGMRIIYPAKLLGEGQ